MNSPSRTPYKKRRKLVESGLILLELIVACTILLISASASLPLNRKVIVGARESELRRDLREMPDAIDRYKDMADKNLIGIEVGSEGYPPRFGNSRERIVRGRRRGHQA